MEEKIKKILLFGGTSEGREIAEYISGRLDAALTVSVATEYGEKVLDLPSSVKVLSGRLLAEEMSELMKELSPDLCIDATHPYARLVSENIFAACERTQTRYIRAERGAGESISGYISAGSVREAVKLLSELEGNILITTGAKELCEYTALADYQERCYARVLPLLESIEECKRNSFQAKNIIAMQGPFSSKMNEAIINEYNIKNLVTKNSGERGGFFEKCMAAKKCGVNLIVVERPVENNDAAVLPVEEVFLYLNKHCICKDVNGMDDKKPEVCIVAMGPGGRDYMTNKAVDSIKAADLIIGARRLLETAKAINNNRAEYIECYKKDEILNQKLRLQGFKKAVLLYSGDLGLSSGANGMLQSLREEGYKVSAVSGVSSVHYMLNSIGISWENVNIISSHGRCSDINELIKCIRMNRYTALLPQGKEQVLGLAEVLAEAYIIHLGSSLTLENERINSFDKVDEAFFEYVNTMDSLFVAVFERKEIS